MAALVGEFEAIGEDPEKFKAFVDAAEARKNGAREPNLVRAPEQLMNPELSSLKAAPLILNRSDGPRWTPATVRKALGKA
jgi:hypothetical protein